MNKLYSNLEIMYSKVAKRNSQLEMLCLTNNFDPETEELLFPDQQNKKLVFPEQQNKKLVQSDLPKFNNKESVKPKELVKVTKVQVPDNLQDILRPKIQRREKSIEKKTNSKALKPHELPASKIKQTDDKPKYVKDYWNNDQLKLTGTMIKNKREGLWKEFNREGQILSESNYLNGKKDGICKEWYPNGKLRTEGTFENGLKHGIFKVFDPKITYAQNPDSKVTRDPTIQIVKECNTYAHGKKIKSEKFKSDDGFLKIDKQRVMQEILDYTGNENPNCKDDKLNNMEKDDESIDEI